MSLWERSHLAGKLLLYIEQLVAFPLPTLVAMWETTTTKIIVVVLLLGIHSLLYLGV